MIEIEEPLIPELSAEILHRIQAHEESFFPYLFEDRSIFGNQLAPQRPVSSNIRPSGSARATSIAYPSSGNPKVTPNAPSACTVRFGKKASIA
jgi:hypothetical protein